MGLSAEVFGDGLHSIRYNIREFLKHLRHIYNLAAH